MAKKYLSADFSATRQAWWQKTPSLPPFRGGSREGDLFATPTHPPTPYLPAWGVFCHPGLPISRHVVGQKPNQKPDQKMSTIQNQIDAAKYAKRIVKTITEKVPENLRATVIALVKAELDAKAAQPAPAANPLEG